MINVVFDLDDTLYSLLPVFEKTLHQFMPEHTLDVHDFYIAFREEANKLFTDSQTGKISMETLHRLRAQNAFKRYGIVLEDQQADTFHAIYDSYKENIALSDEAIDIIHLMDQYGFKTGIITNGTSQKQRKTMRCLDITRYFTDERLIIISGELGIDKPDHRIFDAWTDRIQNASPSLYVGDSFTHDIIGAYQAGWTPIWYNPLNKHHPEVDFDFIEIKSLSELKTLPIITDNANSK